VPDNCLAARLKEGIIEKKKEKEKQPSSTPILSFIRARKR
jgi:hypothetical protein